ncbi:hypothetical protein V5279_02385 [Bradyrhizobium sp. 26S5]|uniref:hypothetical protein n=1 Tax=Bradyrhizobium sp. 26S5 TaxID=3139729 RepID=UPI0030CB95D0
MTARTPREYRASIAIGALLLGLLDPSGALARGGSFPRDDPWNAERIDNLPPDIRNAVLHMCGSRPNAGRYFATYLDNSRVVRLHFEHSIARARSNCTTAPMAVCIRTTPARARIII